MDKNIEWNFFDWEADALVTTRARPHICQTALTFVTFRLDDSMPKEVVRQWIVEQEKWFQENGFGQHGIDQALRHGVLPEPLRRQFLKMRNQGWHKSLDHCHGSCLLREPTCAKVVADSLLKFNEDRYDLERFVVMPNHVHLLVQMREGWKLQEQCESWLRFTGRTINAMTSRTGRFWQTEPFDHVVRNDRQFEYLQSYIAENPSKARLRENEFLLWTRKEGYIGAPPSESQIVAPLSERR